MADELKTDETTSTLTDGKETMVTITQEKLDSLINDKFSKGAKKANETMLQELGVENLDSLKAILKAKNDADDAAKTELEKALDTVEAMKNINSELLSKGEKLAETNHINKLASQNKVKDVEYFEFKYSQAKASENFNEDTFIESFNSTNPTVAPKTDNSSNNGDNPSGKNLKKMSINELKAYQATL